MLEKKSTHLEYLEFWKFFDVCSTKFVNCQILLCKISHRFLVTTKLFGVRKSLIDFSSKVWVLFLNYENTSKMMNLIETKNEKVILLIA